MGNTSPRHREVCRDVVNCVMYGVVDGVVEVKRVARDLCEKYRYERTKEGQLEMTNKNCGH